MNFKYTEHVMRLQKLFCAIVIVGCLLTVLFVHDLPLTPSVRFTQRDDNRTKNDTGVTVNPMYFKLATMIYSSRQWLVEKWQTEKPFQLYIQTNITDHKYRRIKDFWNFHERPRSETITNCSSLLLDSSITLSSNELRSNILETSCDDLIKRNSTSKCDLLLVNRGYVLNPLTTDEQDFPIAYSVIIYKNVYQFELLLRAIYRPQNFYCIHVDRKSSKNFKDNVERLLSCFGSNVFQPNETVSVVWGKFSVLKAELICLKELYNKSSLWKYFINLTGQEFPLRTNYELVKILKAFNGTNDIWGTIKRLERSRIAAAGPVPHNLTAVKGPVHVVLCREFVDYVLHNNISRDLLEWSKAVIIPDEIYFSTLNYNPSLKVPGYNKGLSYVDSRTQPFFARFKVWMSKGQVCGGKVVRQICIFGPTDLPTLASRPELFANKFHLEHKPETLHCLDELIYNRTVAEYHGHLDFNFSYYVINKFNINTT